MILNLILWIVSIVGMVGIIFYRSWQIRTGKIAPEEISHEVENPLSPAKIHSAGRVALKVSAVHGRTFAIRALKFFGALAHIIRLKLDAFVKKVYARIDHEEKVLAKGRAGERFLKAMNEYKAKIRHTRDEVARDEEVQ